MSFSIAKQRFFNPTPSAKPTAKPQTKPPTTFQKPGTGYTAYTAEVLQARENLQSGFGDFLGQDIPDTARIKGTENNDRIIRRANEIQPHVKIEAGEGNDEVVVRGVKNPGFGVRLGTDAGVTGGEGDDSLRFEGTNFQNKVKFEGGEGQDRLVANGGNSTDTFHLSGGAGDDVIIARGNENGPGGDDDHITADGGAGNDFIKVRTQGGRTNTTQLDGGEGDDELRLYSTGGYNTHQLDGGAGDDRIVIQAGATRDTVNYRASSGEDKVFINGAGQGHQNVKVSVGDEAITIVGANGDVYFTQGEGGTVMRLADVEELSVIGTDGKQLETKFEVAS